MASSGFAADHAVSRQGTRLVDDRPRVETMTSQPSVVYVAPDKMGGMMNVIANLLTYRQPDGLAYHVVLTHNRLSNDARFLQPLPCDSQTTVEYTLPRRESARGHAPRGRRDSRRDRGWSWRATCSTWPCSR